MWGHFLHMYVSESQGRMAPSLVPIWLPAPSSVTEPCCRVADACTGALTALLVPKETLVAVQITTQ